MSETGWSWGQLQDTPSPHVRAVLIRMARKVQADRDAKTRAALARAAQNARR